MGDTAAISRREKMRGKCSGWDHPDERCPRPPSKCLCWDNEPESDAVRHASLRRSDRSLRNWIAWRLALWAMRLMFFVMPRGDARDRLGDYVRMWNAECRQQWKLRYGDDHA